MRHSTTVPATGRNPKTLTRTVAVTAATALVAAGISLGAALPANAAVTDTVSGAELTWGFQTGANSWKIETEGATPVSPRTVTTSITGAALATPFTASSGFTLTGGEGDVDPSTKVGTIDFDSEVTYYPQASYGTLVPDQPWVSFTDFELATSSTDGTLTAIVDWYKNSTTELATPTRVEVATFDITSFEVSDGSIDLVSAGASGGGAAASWGCA